MCIFGAWRRKAPTASSAKLASHTRLLATIVTCANCSLFALVLLFPFTQKTTLSSYISHYRSLVFCVWKPCGGSTSDCAVLLRSRRTKRSGITRGRYLSMRVPLSPPRATDNLVEKCPNTSGRARRVKQHIRWMCCSQSERGGLRCANAEVDMPACPERGGNSI